jgi:23S rRNA pseudouridine1911/1915/1917 synthase
MPRVSGTSHTLEVLPDESGTRLDVFLAARLGLSRAQTRRLLARGAVSLEGRPVAEGAKGIALRSGDKIDVAPFTRPENAAARPQPELPLSVLAEGRGWLAVDKPAGVAVHPLEEDETGTVLNAVLARRPEVQGVGEGGLRSGVVHRLDVDTSGVLLLASDESTWTRLRAGFSAGRVRKLYRALALGRLEGEGEVEVPLLTARHRPARVRVARPGEAGGRGVRIAKLHWRALEVSEPLTLVEVRPTTGFLHQIRAILASLGHPLAGDRLYGPPSDPTLASRHMLHASEIAFEEIEAGADDAPDFARLLASSRDPA